MTLDPRTPVLVGVGQWSNRVDRGEPAVEPADIVAEALRRAADDSGAGAALLLAADALRIVSIFSIRYRNAVTEHFDPARQTHTERVLDRLRR